MVSLFLRRITGSGGDNPIIATIIATARIITATTGTITTATTIITKR